MNFFKHHIGDYDSDTAHLTWLEDMAYTRLMRLYYRREEPIPADHAQACRLVRATSKQERDAVESVLKEFFVLQDDGWHNKRCDEEIVCAQCKAEKNREVGKLGGRPRKTETIGDKSKTMMVSENNHDGFKTKPNHNPSQTPDTRHQTPEDKTHGTQTLTVVDAPSADSVCLSVAKPEIETKPLPAKTPQGAICRAIKELGIAPNTLNPSHPTLLALIDAGATVEEFRGAARDAVRKGKSDFGYVIGIVRNRREEAAKLVLQQGAIPNKQEALEASNRAATAGWKPPELRGAQA